MPCRKYGNPDVLDYLSKKYGRGQRQMRNLLGQFRLMQELKEERAEREREWGFKEEEQARRQERLRDI